MIRREEVLRLSGNETKVEFTIDYNAFTETSTKKISNVTLVIEYENPQAHGYPEVWHWTEEYDFDVDEIRRNINE